MWTATATGPTPPWIATTATPTSTLGSPRCATVGTTTATPLTDEAGTAAIALGGVYTDATASLAPGYRSYLYTDQALHLCAGTWYGQLFVYGDGTSIVGHPDAASVTLHADGEFAPLLHLAGAAQSVADVTLTGGVGSGVYCDLADVQFTRATITNNGPVSYYDLPAPGGGVWSTTCNLVFEDTTIHANRGDAGGIHLSGGSLTATRTTVSANEGDVGGLVMNAATSVVSASTFEDNVGTSGTRDLAITSGGDVQVQDTDFGPNSSAVDDSAVLVEGARRGAGTYLGLPVDLGRDFACTGAAGSVTCTP